LKAPYGFPSEKGKWKIQFISRSSYLATITSGTWAYTTGAPQLQVPAGKFILGVNVVARVNVNSGSGTYAQASVSPSTSSTVVSMHDYVMSAGADFVAGGSAFTLGPNLVREEEVNNASMTPYYLLFQPTTNGTLATNSQGFWLITSSPNSTSANYLYAYPAGL
jgi:hypothetical protein